MEAQQEKKKKRTILQWFDCWSKWLKLFFLKKTCFLVDLAYKVPCSIDFLQEKADIRDKDDAKPLILKGGDIQFDNVHFRFDDGSFFIEICLTDS